MTESRTIPVSTVVTYGLWSLVFTFIFAGWICTAAGQRQVALMLGLNACACSAVAATASIRCFTLRTQRLIRALHGIEPGEMGEAATVSRLTPLHTL